MFVVLTVIALLSAAALAFTYSQTRPILEEQARQRQILAVSQVVPAFDNEPTAEALSPEGFDGIEVYPATRNGQRVGTAVRSWSGNGYGGTITVMVGFDPDGAITGATVLAHTETPGLGAKLTEESFLAQFEGMRVSGTGLAVAKDGGSVDAITAATISTRAFVEAVNRAWQAVEATRAASPGNAETVPGEPETIETQPGDSSEVAMNGEGRQ
jgi:electron transport complex protein RnfG